ncbi:GPI inositol deacylase [Coemansia sp. RSA 2711]|nr:GPI inositol deacylase [Coemansia sp. RSA 2711]
MRAAVLRFVSAHISLLCLLLVTAAVGLLTTHSYFNGQADVANCAMSYSRPRYIEQTEFGRSWTRYSAKYKLYLYREGGFDVHNQAFRIPVLFVPGNAGSHKQVRSIASATASAFVELVGKRPELVDQGMVGYDFFTLGLNEELTALHGYSILEQADFVNDAIRYILAQYPRTRARHRLSKDTEFASPASVVVVGHSMGGVVARTAFTLGNHMPGSAQALFTLSTPHSSPTASLEWHVEQVYTRVNQFWRHGFRNGTLDDVSLVSIAGGNLDSMINSDYTYVGSLAPARNALSVLSSGINDVWLGQDHQSVLWCGQMARKFAAMMIEIMDARSPSQLVPLDQRMAIMRRQLLPSIDRSVETQTHDRPMRADNYRYVQLAEDSVKLHPLDLRKLAERSQARPRKARALHLLPSGIAAKDKVLQILYDPQLFADASSDSERTDVQLALLGCRGNDTGTVADADLDVECETLLIPEATKLPLKRDGDDPAAPVHSLHYIEIPVASLKQHAFVGIELPAKYGTDGFLQAEIVTRFPPAEQQVGIGQLLWPAAVSMPANGGMLGVRSRIRILMPEDPLVVYRARITMQRDATAGALTMAPRFGTVVRQSDGRRQFESKFWYDASSVDLAIHGRGAYATGDPSLDGDLWDGLDVDVWADADYFGGMVVDLRINWYSSLNRLVKRYDMALLALSFAWACAVLLCQLRAWTNGHEFPSSLQAIERLVRGGALAAAVVAAMAIPLVQIGVAHAMRDSWSATALARWNNLFMGARGGGWAQCVAAAVLAVMALGFVACQAVVLASMCELSARALAWKIGHSSDLNSSGSEPGRMAMATTAFAVLVSTLIPYQFAFLVIYMAQLLTAARTQARGAHNLGKYQQALLLFWTSSLPYCAPELLVWVRNLSVLWLEDAAADHNILNMAGYFALRLLAAYRMVPSAQPRWLSTSTAVCFGAAVACAWLVCVRRPFVLYDVANALSAWLALIQLADYPLRLFASGSEPRLEPSSSDDVLQRKLR